MASDRLRLNRLRRIERVRAVAKEMKLAEAAQAESTLTQLRALAERTRAMAASYSQRADPGDALQLSSILTFSHSLHSISDKVAADMVAAKAFADRLGADVTAAERRRATAEDRANQQQAAMNRSAAAREFDTMGRRGFGTKFE
jgi:hypothetical protein